MSSITQIPFIAEGSQATPGLFNRAYQIANDNFASLASGINFSEISNVTMGGFLHAPVGIAAGTYPPISASDRTTSTVFIGANSSQSQYVVFHDDSALRSSYALGSHFVYGDGLTLYDLSGSTALVTFSKQSIRFHQNVVAPVLDQAGAVVNGKSFGMQIDGLTDDTAVLQSFLNNTPGRLVVLIPSTGTCIINSTITIGPYKTIVNLGAVRRPSTSTYTGPVFQLMGGEYPSLVGQGALNSFIMCENASPEGIVLCGVQDSEDSVAGMSNRFGAVRGLTLVGNSGLTSVGLNFRSTQPYLSGTCYDFQCTDLQIQNVGVGIKQHTLTNANLFANINMFGITNVGIWCAGNSDGSALISDCAYANIVITSSPSLRTVLMCKNTGDTAFNGIVTEPEAGDLLQVDETCSRLYLMVADNIASFGSWTPGSSIRLQRGVAQIGKFSVAATEITPTSIGTMDLGSHQALPWKDLNMTGTVWWHNNAAVRRGALTSDATSELVWASNAGTEILRVTTSAIVPGTALGLDLGTHQAKPIDDINMGDTIWFHNDAAVRRGAILSDATSEVMWTNNSGTELFRVNATEIKPGTAMGLNLGTHQVKPFGNLQMGDTQWFHNAGASRRLAIVSDATNELAVFNSTPTEVLRLSTTADLRPASASGVTLGTPSLPFRAVHASGMSIGAGGSLIPVVSSTSSRVAAFVVQGSSSSFTFVTWALAQPGDHILTTILGDAAASSLSSGLVMHSHCTAAGQIELRLSNVSTLAQNQSMKTYFFTLIRPF